MFEKKSKIKISHILTVTLSLAFAMFPLTACQNHSNASDNREPFIPETVATLEGEAAAFGGNVTSGSEGEIGYATGFAQDGDYCRFTAEVPAAGFYDLVFTARSTDYKENQVFVNGSNSGTIVTEGGTFMESTVPYVYLDEGSNQIEVTKYWGWVDIDKMVIQTAEPVDESIYEVSAVLVNKKASKNTKRLMSYLADTYGKQVISGQYCDQGPLGKEFQVIQKQTGKQPAVIGLDFMEYTPSRVANGSIGHATDVAKQFWEDGGIVTFCWHWNAPEKYLTGVWYSGFYKEHTNIDLAKIMRGDDPEGYDLLMADIDAIAEQLLILQDAGVPILWRPLHEASGGWFWWGAAGAESYKQLYVLLYEKLTNEYGLNNLIWVWNGQDADWYPGDEYVDIIGWDIYPGEHEYGSQVATFRRSFDCTDAKKIITLSENGCVPNPELLKRDHAMWSYWGTWGGEFVAKPAAIYSYSDQYTESDKLKEFYESELVVTREELPDLTEYPIRKELK